MEKNDRLAERNRGFFQAKKLFVLNLLSAPGSGKTTLILQTAAKLAGKLRVGVIVGAVVSWILLAHAPQPLPRVRRTTPRK